MQRTITKGHNPAGLAERIARWTAGMNRLDTDIEGLSLHRWETPTEPSSYMMAPSICLIGQGRKRLILGEEVFEYDASRFLITSLDLPVVAQITLDSELRTGYGTDPEHFVPAVAADLCTPASPGRPRRYIRSAAAHWPPRPTPPAGPKTPARPRSWPGQGIVSRTGDDWIGGGSSAHFSLAESGTRDPG